jgi:hypothetical protein
VLTAPDAHDKEGTRVKSSVRGRCEASVLPHMSEEILALRFEFDSFVVQASAFQCRSFALHHHRAGWGPMASSMKP